jgi:hypothetical protein
MEVNLCGGRRSSNRDEFVWNAMCYEAMRI